MSQITWNDSYSVGNEEIDAQHKRWIALYNTLDHTLLHGSQQEMLTLAKDILQAMQEYADYHFRSEEQYMQEINYPGLIAHKRIHTDFGDDLYNLNRAIKHGGVILNTELLNIIKTWLLQHILHEDQKYRIFMNRE